MRFRGQKDNNENGAGNGIDRNINQKYKYEVISGKREDDMAGFDGSNNAYDEEMMKKETIKRTGRKIPLVILGLIFIYLTVNLISTNVNLSKNGTKVRAYYVENSEYCRHTANGKTLYDGYAVTIKDDEDKPATGVTKLSREVTTHIKASLELDGKEFEKANNKYKHSAGDEKYKETTAYKIVISVQPSSVPIYEISKNEYIDLYYIPENGDDYMKLRMLNTKWFIIAMTVFTVVYNSFVVWIIIRGIKKGKIG